MQTSSIVKAALTGALLSVLGAALFSTGAQELSSADQSGGFESVQFSGLEEYKVEESGQEEVAGIETQHLYAENGSKRLEVKLYSDIGESFAENIIKDRNSELKSIYADVPAPYGGIPERNVNCDEGYGLNSSTTEEEHTYTLYANEEYSLGACSTEDVKYRVKIKMNYCPNVDTLFESRFFAPEGSEIKTQPEIRCG